MLKHRDFAGMLVTMHQSGTHWVKYILTSAIYHEKGFDQPTSIHDEDRFIGNPKSHRGRPGVPSITASHSIPHILLGSRLMHQVMTFPRYVILVRDIRASLVSNYEKWKPACGFSEYLRGDVRGKRFNSDIWWCIRFNNAWGRVLKNVPDKATLIRYESMKEDTYAEFSKLVDFMGLEISRESIEFAIRFSDKEAMAKRQNPDADDLQVVRKDNRPPEEWFSGEDMQFFKETCRQYLKYDMGYTY